MKDSKKSSLLGHRLRFRWLFLFSLFAGPLALPLGGQSAIAANNIAQQQKVSVTGKVVDNLGYSLSDIRKYSIATDLSLFFM